MARKKPVVVITRKLPDAIETRMMELFDARLNVDDTLMTAEQLIDAVKTADVLVPTVTDRIDKQILSAAGPNLKLVANFGAGVDHIDLVAAREAGVTVTNTPGVPDRGYGRHDDGAHPRGSAAGWRRRAPAARR